LASNASFNFPGGMHEAKAIIIANEFKYFFIKYF
jgi:hypothetical protein